MSLATVWKRDTFNSKPIRDAIRLSDLTQEEICDRARLSRNQLYLIMNGGNTKEDTLTPLLEVLGLTWEDITPTP